MRRLASCSTAVASTLPEQLPRALVWGGAGFIGSHLVSRLLTLPCQVTVLVRRGTSCPFAWRPAVCWQELPSHRDRAVYREAAASADVIFNLAGSSGAVASNEDIAGSLEANGRAQVEFLEACRETRCQPHVVLASSWLVYGRTGDGPTDERHPVNPRSAYAIHKYSAERYHAIFADRGALTFTVCRISNPYGWDHAAERKRHGVLNTFITRAVRGLPLTIFGDGSQLRDYLHVSNLVDALVRCGFNSAARNQVFNIGRGVSVSLRDAARTLEELAGVQVSCQPWPDEYAHVESGDYVADVRLVRDRLGFTCAHDLRSGLLVSLKAAERSLARERDRALRAPRPRVAMGGV